MEMQKKKERKEKAHLRRRLEQEEVEGKQEKLKLLQSEKIGRLSEQPPSSHMFTSMITVVGCQLGREVAKEARVQKAKWQRHRGPGGRLHKAPGELPH